MSLRKIFSSILLLVVISGLAAINADAGTTGFTSLKIPYSARALGMGQAMTGVTASIDGLQFNPAAIMQIQDKVVSSTFNSWLVDTHAGGIHMLLPRNEYVTLGLLAHYLNYGEIERTEIGPNNEYIGTDDKFAPSNLIVGLTAARYINASIDLGASLKFVYDNIYESSATAVMIDAGLVHHPFNEKIKVGVSIRNLGKQLSYYTGEKYVEKLPFTFASGISYKLSPAFLAAVDISKPAGQDVLIKVGAEYQVHPMLALRTGYRSNAADWKTGGTWDWASGLSLGSGFSWKSYQLDYAIASYGDLGFNNQVTLGYKF